MTCCVSTTHSSLEVVSTPILKAHTSDWPWSSSPPAGGINSSNMSTMSATANSDWPTPGQHTATQWLPQITITINIATTEKSFTVEPTATGCVWIIADTFTVVCTAGKTVTVLFYRAYETLWYSASMAVNTAAQTLAYFGVLFNQSNVPESDSSHAASTLSTIGTRLFTGWMFFVLPNTIITKTPNYWLISLAQDSTKCTATSYHHSTGSK